MADRPWKIYHLEREYAKEHGDPCIGTVWAPSQAEWPQDIQVREFPETAHA